MDSLYGPFVLRGRTNLCPVTGMTGKGRESRWAGRARECARMPRLAAFSQPYPQQPCHPNAGLCAGGDLWLRRFFMKKKQAFLLAFMKNTIFAENYFGKFIDLLPKNNTLHRIIES